MKKQVFCVLSVKLKYSWTSVIRPPVIRISFNPAAILPYTGCPKKSGTADFQYLAS